MTHTSVIIVNSIGILTRHVMLPAQNVPQICGLLPSATVTSPAHKVSLSIRQKGRTVITALFS